MPTIKNRKMLAYTVRISGVKDGSHEDFFDINGKFFESFVNADITNCKIKVISVLMKYGNKLKLNLGLKGEIYNLFCDLCASEITVPVDIPLESTTLSGYFKKLASGLRNLTSLELNDENASEN